MAEEMKKIEEPELELEASQTPEEDAWMAGMEGAYPDLKGNREALFKASREGYDREHKLNKDNADAYGRIYAAIDRSPEMGAFINKIVEPDSEEFPEEAVLAFGEDLKKLITGEYDTEAYRKAKKAAEEKRAAEEKAKADEEAKNEAIGQAFVDACQELGLDPEATEKKILAKFNGEDATEFMANKEFFKAIIQSLTYEDDMLAAEARGRSAQMTERNARRSAGSDGLPRSGANAGQGRKYNPNSLAAMAEKRRLLNS